MFEAGEAGSSHGKIRGNGQNIPIREMMFPRMAPIGRKQGEFRRVTILAARAARLCVVAAALWCSVAAAQSQLPTDRLLNSLTATADVNDFAGILTPAEREALEARCRELREKTGSQLAVV